MRIPLPNQSCFPSQSVWYTTASSS